MRTRSLLALLIVAGMTLPCPAGEAPSKEKIDKLIKQMGSSNFAEREKATKELEAIGALALDALRKAAKSRDVEVRERARAILGKIDNEREIPRVLAPKRVRLVYKDTPLLEALADFEKKSGYHIDLCRPERKIKERRITLDTGETTFWHAVGLLCKKAELIEGNIKDLKPDMIVDNRAIVGNRKISQPAETEHLILKDGKTEKWPTDDRGAIRVRTVGKYDKPGKVPEGEVILALELSREPSLQWELFLTIEIDKAVDNYGQKLTQVMPGAKEGIKGGFGAVLIPAGAVVRGPLTFHGPSAISSIGKFPGLSQQVPLQLRKGKKAAKSIVELKGFITATLLTEAEEGNAKDRRAKLGLPAPKRVVVDIPFALKNVPLP